VAATSDVNTTVVRPAAMSQEDDELDEDEESEDEDQEEEEPEE
jgi:hypothetical protein